MFILEVLYDLCERVEGVPFREIVTNELAKRKREKLGLDWRTMLAGIQKEEEVVDFISFQVYAHHDRDVEEILNRIEGDHNNCGELWSYLELIKQAITMCVEDAKVEQHYWEMGHLIDFMGSAWKNVPTMLDAIEAGDTGAVFRWAVHFIAYHLWLADDLHYRIEDELDGMGLSNATHKDIECKMLDVIHLEILARYAPQCTPDQKEIAEQAMLKRARERLQVWQNESLSQIDELEIQLEDVMFE